MGKRPKKQIEYDCIEIGRARDESLKVLIPEEVASYISKLERRWIGTKTFGLLMGNKYEDENHVIVYVDHIVPVGGRFKVDKLQKSIKRVSKKKNGNEIVGWYRACAGLGAMLVEEYQSVHRELFSKPWHFIYLVDEKTNSTNLYHWHVGKLRRSKGYYQLIGNLNADKNNRSMERQDGNLKNSYFIEEHDGSVEFRELINKYQNNPGYNGSKNRSKFIRRLCQSGAMVAAAAVLLVVWIQYINSDINPYKPDDSSPMQIGDNTAVEEVVKRENQKIEDLENVISNLKKELESKKDEIVKLKEDAYNTDNKGDIDYKDNSTNINEDHRANLDGIDNGNNRDNKHSFDKTADAAESENAAAELTPHNDTVIYIIQKGDTLSSISENYYGDPSYKRALGRVNRINNYSYIMAGDFLIIPPKEEIEKWK